ncbi:MAG: copper homeostasis protein CutC [Bacillota bacterium]
MSVTLEVIAVTVNDAAAAEEGGADRLEVVANLTEGGVTPSAGVIAAIRRATRLPIYVMIRPRGGPFQFTPAEVDAMVTDARVARELGADGLVVGALNPDGSIDQEALMRILEAGQLPATFHRAFEALRDPVGALDQLAGLPRIERVLTSGGRENPADAAAGLRRLVRHDFGRIEVMVGGGVTLANAAHILRETGATALHTASAVREPQLHTARVSADRVRQMRLIIDQVAGAQ